MNSSLKMSILVTRPQIDETAQAELLTPSENNIWTAGETTPQIQVEAPRAISDAKVRTMHQGLHDGQQVQAYIQFAPTPTGLTGSSVVPQQQQCAAIQELSEYACNLTQPVKCQRVQNSAPGSAVYESVDSYAPLATVENLANNMRAHDICMKCTISAEHYAFQPFTVKLTADDLQNCIAHTQSISAGGCESKFIQTKSQVAPHSVLFHIVQNPKTAQHHIYGINFTEKSTFD